MTAGLDTLTARVERNHVELQQKSDKDLTGNAGRIII